jgi:hypothetical protein
MIYSAIVATIVSAALNSANASEVTFPADQNCVAWKASKTMFLVKSQEPVGTTCKLKLEITPTETLPTQAGLKLTFPISSFDSGEPDRDKEVQLILKVPEHPNMVVTAEVSKDQKDQIISGSLKTLSVSVRYGGIEVPLKIDITELTENIVKGVAKTSFTEMKLAQPKVLGGLVAKVHDPLELWFQLNRKELIWPQ